MKDKIKQLEKKGRKQWIAITNGLWTQENKKKKTKRIK